MQRIECSRGVQQLLPEGLEQEQRRPRWTGKALPEPNETPRDAVTFAHSWQATLLLGAVVNFTDKMWSGHASVL